MIYTVLVQDCPMVNRKLLDDQWCTSNLTGVLKGHKKRGQNGLNWIDLYFQGNLFQYLLLKIVLFGHATVIRGWRVDFLEEFEAE